MNVIYDISVLGLGYYYERAKTGVYRVVENIARELLFSDCQISFSASHALFETIKYLKTSEGFRHIPLCNWSNPLIKNVFETIINRTYPDPDERPGKNVHILKSIVKKIVSTTTTLDDFIKSADIYHSTHFPLPIGLKPFKTQRFLTIYDLIPIIHPEYFGNTKNHMIIRAVESIRDDDWVIAISESTKNDLCNLAKIEPERVFVTLLAASDIFYKCEDDSLLRTVCAKYGIPESQYILSLSTLEPRKNIEHTIRCFLNMIQQQNINDLNLVLVGTKGWDYEGIFSEVNNSGTLRDRIIVTGYVNDVDLAPLYSCASMFVYPSLYEGFGLPILEAMQCGVPVIASNTSSMPEVVGDAGIMVDPEDGNALCQSMLKIYNSTEVRQKMSDYSLMQASKFSWEKCARQTIDAYKVALLDK